MLLQVRSGGVDTVALKGVCGWGVVTDVGV